MEKKRYRYGVALIAGLQPLIFGLLAGADYSHTGIAPAMTYIVGVFFAFMVLTYPG